MDVTKLTVEELLDFLAGSAIIKLGQGSTIRNIIWEVFDATSRWQNEQDKKKKKR